MIDRSPGSGANAAVLYLGAPAVLFLLMFVRLPIGAAILALILVAAWLSRRTLPADRAGWIPAATGAVALALLAGFPNGPYPWDWVKHWALIGELSRHPWPLVIELDGEPRYLRYYLGAYLVPALFHRLVPQIALWLPTAIWFALGFALVLQRAARIAPRPALQWLAVLLVLLLGGADVYGHFGYRLLQEYPVPFFPMLGLHQESWWFNAESAPLEYSSMLTALAWVPHQAIATFLVAGLFTAQPEDRSLPGIFLAFGLLALWSPYGMIGLLPLVFTVAFQHRREILRLANVLAIAAGATFALIVAWYLATELPTGGACFTCVPGRLPQFISYVPFLTVELIPFVLMLGSRIVSDIPCRVAAVTLLVIPLTFGQSGDFVMRASLGPLFVLGLGSIGAFISDWPAARRRLLHATAVILCAPTALSEAIYLRTAGQAHLAFSPRDPLRAPWMTDFARGDQFTAREFFDRCGWRYLPQYFTVVRPTVFQPATDEPAAARDAETR